MKLAEKIIGQSRVVLFKNEELKAQFLVLEKQNANGEFEYERTIQQMAYDEPRAVGLFSTYCRFLQSVADVKEELKNIQNF